MLSFWENQSFIEYDHIIIGSGIVGLSTAISIKEKQPDTSVLVLERGLLPSGASTKNAGFACFGSVSELLEDIKVMGRDQALALVMERYLGLIKLRERLGDEKIDYHNYGGYELIREQDWYCVDEIEKVNDLLADVFDTKPFEVDNKSSKKFGFNTDMVKTLIYSRYEGQIDTGRMMKNLVHLAQSLGVCILTGAIVEGFEEDDKGIRVMVSDQVYGSLAFKGQKLAICTNAFTSQLVKDLELVPGRGIVLVTKPIPNLKFKGVFHCERGYYYFRNFENRVIFGGGRNLDYEKETTTRFEINERILNELKHQLNEIILPDTPYIIDQTWAGIMAFGKNKQPVLKQYSERICLGVRLGGMGVAIGSRMGHKLAEMMI
ncbi:Oxidoreductase [Fulvivirga imtechensis AK7]|uniref:Oxidoreductase n=1 Tax=Fulvivirga imtechensis AK7 TaxID=1237149 RepID=L8JP04_9BACT|nr:FAD-dependent oxidoreductase [Fulvivirga imtechensis]ELR69112.1 Oxidoreductase [Fulvivirga imtechensis AK7]